MARRRCLRLAVRYGRCGWVGWSACSGCSASRTWSRSAGGGWWIAIGLSRAGQFLGRRRSGRGASMRCWPAACRVRRHRRRGPRGVRTPGDAGLSRGPGVVRARSGRVVDPVSLIASAWPSRMRDCDGGLRPESRCGQTGVHSWPRRRAHGRRCARSVGRSSAGSPAQGPAGRWPPVDGETTDQRDRALVHARAGSFSVLRSVAVQDWSAHPDQADPSDYAPHVCCMSGALVR